MTVTQMMIPVQEMDAVVKTVLEETSEELARETGFVQRRREISGAQFAQALIFGWLHNPNASYTQLQQMLALLGSTASAQALEKRMNERAADFLLSLLHALLGLCVESDGVMSELLSRFEGVYLQDGTIIGLPDSLQSLYKAAGGRYEQGGRAGLRVQVRLNVSTGALLGPWVQEAVLCERKGAGSTEACSLPAQALYVTDATYMTIEKMRQAQHEHWSWLTHARADWLVTDATGIRSTLPQLLQRRGKLERIDEWVKLGKQEQPVRLIAFRVSEPTQERRQQQEGQACKTRGKGSRRDVRVGNKHAIPSLNGRHRHRTSRKRQLLREWTILLCNVRAEQLQAHEARVLMRSRWQIELLWRLWKERGLLDLWRSEKPMRILCEIYAKLIGLVIQHWLILRGCWQQPHRSLVKASQAVHLLAIPYLLSLSGPVTTERLGELLAASMQRSRLNTRPTRFSTAQLLEEPGRVFS